MLRRLALALAVGIVPIVLAAVPARAAGGTAEAFLGKINALRASVGAAPLAEDATLDGVAQQWSNSMAASKNLSHNQSLASQVPAGWTLLGENVGFGPDVDTIFNAFVNSSHHYENLVDKAFNRVGIGVAVGSDGLIYTTHDFEAVPGGASTAAARPRTTAPKPASSPKPTSPAPKPAAPKPVPPAAATASPPPSAGPAPAPPPELSPRLALSLRLLQGQALG